MDKISIKNIELDEKTSAMTSILRTDKIRSDLPNKFLTTSELNAFKKIGIKNEVFNEVIVCGKLIFPDTLKNLLTNEDFLKKFVKNLSREIGNTKECLNLLFFVFKGKSKVENIEDFKTILDIQYFLNFDIITVQQMLDVSHEKFDSMLKFSLSWMDERGLDKPLMPILQALSEKDEFEKYLQTALKYGPSCIGIDMRGSFYYHTLSALENLKKRKPNVWVHSFQVPPKIKFGGKFFKCSQGMIMPTFGIDSFSRWVVPPPPEPLTIEKINIFNRKDWGVFKKDEWFETHGNELSCTCSVCSNQNLDTLFSGKVLSVLSKGKIHDHFALREELEESRNSIKERNYKELIVSKKYPREFLKEIEKV
ncbi:MAG: hypothetical protein QW265_05040 [Candidatus Bathyarchaeia archaeon]